MNQDLRSILVGLASGSILVGAWVGCSSTVTDSGANTGARPAGAAARTAAPPSAPAPRARRRPRAPRRTVRTNGITSSTNCSMSSTTSCGTFCGCAVVVDDGVVVLVELDVVRPVRHAARARVRRRAGRVRGRRDARLRALREEPGHGLADGEDALARDGPRRRRPHHERRGALRLDDEARRRHRRRRTASRRSPISTKTTTASSTRRIPPSRSSSCGATPTAIARRRPPSSSPRVDLILVSIEGARLRRRTPGATTRGNREVENAHISALPRRERARERDGQPSSTCTSRRQPLVGAR